MKIEKAVIPMAGAAHRALPLQTLAAGDGSLRPVVDLHLGELVAAGVRAVALVVSPAARPLFADLAERHRGTVVLLEQAEPRGYGAAVLEAADWLGRDPFLLQVCDHVFLSHGADSCTRQLLRAAEAEGGAVSAVQATHESQLPWFGIVGGRRVRGREDLYTVDTVLEKPTPTEAEQRCQVAGLRHGTYLGFFGLHALGPALLDLLRELAAALPPGRRLGLSEALAELARRERLLALEVRGRRVDLEGRHGLLRAQLALGLAGAERAEVLRVLLEEVARSRDGEGGPAAGTAEGGGGGAGRDAGGGA